MKKLVFLIAATLILSSCAPVLSRELMKQGSRDVSFALLREDPDAYRGRLYILGGIIVETRLTEKGSAVEALFMPVDSYGYLDESKHSQGRFLAIYPRAKGLLDPVVYKRGREITLAGDGLSRKKSVKTGG